MPAFVLLYYLHLFFMHQSRTLLLKNWWHLLGCVKSFNFLTSCQTTISKFIKQDSTLITQER